MKEKQKRRQVISEGRAKLEGLRVSHERANASSAAQSVERVQGSREGSVRNVIIGPHT